MDVHLHHHLIRFISAYLVKYLQSSLLSESVLRTYRISYHRPAVVLWTGRSETALTMSASSATNVFGC